MAEGQKKKISLFRETWKSLKASWKVWWHWAAGIGLIMGIVHWYYGQRTPASQPFMELMQDHPHYLKDHPDQWQPFIHAMLNDLILLAIYLAFTLLIESIAYYFILAGYLRFSGAKPPANSINNYFYWFKQVVWKYTKPSLWALIPFIGVFLYIRSTIRYAVVSPLAMLDRGDELQKSWNMTEGNWWRLFLNQMGINIVVTLLVWLAAIVPLLAVLIIAYGNQHAPLYRGMLCLVQGIVIGIGMVLGAVYSCNAYRVLKQEGKIKA
jgi:hypothetical protein